MKGLTESLHRPCGQSTFAAWTGDRCALAVRVDVAPLSPLGEVAALTEGRRTYLARDRYLIPRDRWTIPGQPPSHARPVHAEHLCSQPVPEAWLLPPLPTPAPAILTDLEVPF